MNNYDQKDTRILVFMLLSTVTEKEVVRSKYLIEALTNTNAGETKEDIVNTAARYGVLGDVINYLKYDSEFLINQFYKNYGE